jgi:inorganic triphosphatase YgiF
MNEIELKFQVPAGKRRAVEAAVAGTKPGRRIHLQAAYFDTPSGVLAATGLALRLRKEGRVWVQTLKGATADGTGMRRLEHNVARSESGATPPAIDPQLHADTEVGAALLKVLGGLRARSDGPLQQVMATDIWRRSRILRAPGGSVELAFDSGVIEAGPADAPRRLAVCELEIELKSGQPHALVGTALRWMTRFGLWLDTRSKAERGLMLWRDASMAPPQRATEVLLARSMEPAQALDAVLQSCLEQISVNASQIASGVHSPEHVHQLRVGLRRLRTALRFFDGSAWVGVLDDASRLAMSVDAAELFRQLGAARDQDAVAGPLLLALKDALVAVGQPGEAPQLPAGEPAIEPALLVRRLQTQRLLLALIARVNGGTPAAPRQTRGWNNAVDAVTQRHHTPLDTPDAPPEQPLRQRLVQRLNRWHRGVVIDAQAFEMLDDEGRHRLRKHIKRLRYAAEFSASVFDETAVRAYLKGLRSLQERLGTLNDVAVGIAMYSAAAPTDSRALFALGWLASQREAALEDCKPELKRFVELTRFWRVKERKERKKTAKAPRSAGKRRA